MAASTRSPGTFTWYSLPGGWAELIYWLITYYDNLPEDVFVEKALLPTLFGLLFCFSICLYLHQSPRRRRRKHFKCACMHFCCLSLHLRCEHCSCLHLHLRLHLMCEHCLCLHLHLRLHLMCEHCLCLHLRLCLRFTYEHCFCLRSFTLALHVWTRLYFSTQMWQKCMRIVVYGMCVVLFPSWIISSAFKWIIVLRSAIKVVDQMQQVLKKCICHIKKIHIYASTLVVDFTVWLVMKICTC